MIINLGIQTWDEFLEGSAGQTHFNPKAASSLFPKAWVRAALPGGADCTLLKVPEEAGGSCAGYSPGIQVCPGAGSFSGLYKDTGVIRRRVWGQRGPLKLQTHVVWPTLPSVGSTVHWHQTVFSESWHCVSFSKQAIPEGPRLPFLWTLMPSRPWWMMKPGGIGWWAVELPHTERGQLPRGMPACGAWPSEFKEKLKGWKLAF